MDLDRAERALEKAFAPDIGEGTVEVRREKQATVLDGGNWSVGIGSDGSAYLNLPMNDANYYDEDTDAFIGNVIGTEAEQELALADRKLGGALAEGLRRTPDEWSVRMGERLAAARVQSRGCDPSGSEQVS